MAVTTNDFSGLNVKVQSLEHDVQELKHGFNTLAAEMREGFRAVGDAVSASRTTPWVAILSGAGVIVTALGIVGSLALSPLQVDVGRLKTEIVTRTEHDFRDRAQEDRLQAYAKDAELRARDIAKAADDRLAAMQKEIDDRNIATQKATDATIAGINKLMDVEREAVHTSLDRIFQDLQQVRQALTPVLDGKITTTK